ncbi:MAG TPA: DUF2568 domain-containing protein [Puia sp.]|nr:DUF2568 domain-containing protein [Puia sp.]
MNTNPINLAVRFLLAIVILITLGLWGWHLFIGWEKYITALIFPTIIVLPGFLFILSCSRGQQTLPGSGGPDCSNPASAIFPLSTK